MITWDDSESTYPLSLCIHIHTQYLTSFLYLTKLQKQKKIFKLFLYKWSIRSFIFSYGTESVVCSISYVHSCYEKEKIFV